MASIGFFPSLAGMPLVGNAVTGVFAQPCAASGMHSSDAFLSGPSPDALLGVFARKTTGSHGGGRFLSRPPQRNVVIQKLILEEKVRKNDAHDAFYDDVLKKLAPTPPSDDVLSALREAPDVRSGWEKRVTYLIQVRNFLRMLVGGPHFTFHATELERDYIRRVMGQLSEFLPRIGQQNEMDLRGRIEEVFAQMESDIVQKFAREVNLQVPTPPV